jgi:hypothetical protein
VENRRGVVAASIRAVTITVTVASCPILGTINDNDDACSSLLVTVRTRVGKRIMMMILMK